MSDEKGCGSCGSCDGGGCGDKEFKLPDFPMYDMTGGEQPQEPEQPFHVVFDELIGHMINPKNRQLNGFAGVMPFPKRPNFKEPMMVSSTSILGPKLQFYLETGKFMAVGIEAVNLAVNDILCTGGNPLFFMDNISMAAFEPKVVHAFIQGVQVGCDYTDMVILGGRTEVVDGLYRAKWGADVSGTCVGLVDRVNLIDGTKVRPGNVLIGIPSDGLNIGGYHIVRELIKEEKLPWYHSEEKAKELKEQFEALGEDEEAKKAMIDQYKAELKVIDEFAEVLMKPTPQYYAAINAIRRVATIHGMAHIKNGGLVENLPRMVPNKEQREGITFDVSVVFWEPPEIFQRIKTAGEIPDDEMWKHFNNGMGLVLAVDEEDEGNVLEALEDEYIDGATKIGSVIEREEEGKEVNIE